MKSELVAPLYGLLMKNAGEVSLEKTIEHVNSGVVEYSEEDILEVLIHVKELYRKLIKG